MRVFKNIKPEFIDERGAITKILDDGKTAIKSVLLITSKKGTARANHYHKKDSHYCYVLSGKMEWFEKPVGGGEVSSMILHKGDMVFTPPMHIHSVTFLEDSTFLTLATESRAQEDYEADTVKVKITELLTG